MSEIDAVTTTKLAPKVTTTASADDKGRVIRVLLVDDHPVVLEGLRRVLELDKGINVVDEAGGGEEAIRKAVLLSPDVVIMDVKMPGMDGITATRELKQKKPDINVLVLTLYGEDFVKQAIEAGVSGYMLKDSDSEQITKAIHQVHDGFFPIAPSLARGLVTEFAKLSRESHSPLLAERQIEILKLVANGMSSSDIGNHLFISLSTVKREIRCILDKLEVNDRAQAISEAMKRKLI